MLPRVGESIGFLVAIEDGDEKIVTCWSGTVTSYLECETASVIDCGGMKWLVIWDEDLTQYTGIPDVTWYFAHARPIPQMHTFLQAHVIN